MIRSWSTPYKINDPTTPQTHAAIRAPGDRCGALDITGVPLSIFEDC
jgi:hypothetical protein